LASENYVDKTSARKAVVVEYAIEGDSEEEEPKNVPTEEIPEHEEQEVVEESLTADEESYESTSEESQIFLNGKPIKVGEEVNAHVGD
jgi:hypothetical protein